MHPDCTEQTIHFILQYGDSEHVFGLSRTRLYYSYVYIYFNRYISVICIVRGLRNNASSMTRLSRLSPINIQLYLNVIQLFLIGSALACYTNNK